jgi:mersacidin/lichenicidin family type 2 lantibiotic
MLSIQDIVSAWKDEDFRNSLSEEQLAQLPENPAGILELDDEEMENINGGAPAITADTYCAWWSYFTKG